MFHLVQNFVDDLAHVARLDRVRPEYAAGAAVEGGRGASSFPDELRAHTQGEQREKANSSSSLVKMNSQQVLALPNPRRIYDVRGNRCTPRHDYMNASFYTRQLLKRRTDAKCFKHPSIHRGSDFRQNKLPSPSRHRSPGREEAFQIGPLLLGAAAPDAVEPRREPCASLVGHERGFPGGDAGGEGVDLQ